MAAGMWDGGWVLCGRDAGAGDAPLCPPSALSCGSQSLQGSECCQLLLLRVWEASLPFPLGLRGFCDDRRALTRLCFPQTLSMAYLTAMLSRWVGHCPVSLPEKIPSCLFRGSQQLHKAGASLCKPFLRTVPVPREAALGHSHIPNPAGEPWRAGTGQHCVGWR